MVSSRRASSRLTSLKGLGASSASSGMGGTVGMSSGFWSGLPVFTAWATWEELREALPPASGWPGSFTAATWKEWSASLTLL